MTFLDTFQVSLELWGAVFALVCATILILGRPVERRKGRVLRYMLYTDTVLLVSDAVALIFNGDPSEMAVVIVHITNFFVFAAPAVLSGLAVAYLGLLIADNGFRPNMPLLRVAFWLCAGYLAVVILGHVLDWFYYFDETNRYFRRDGYLICSAAAAVVMTALCAVTISSRKSLSAKEMWAMLLYVLLPFATNVIQYFHYGLSLNNMAVTASLVQIFLTFEVEKNRRMKEQETLLVERELAITQQKAELSKKDRELAEKQLQISISQMQPHFAFNALGSIEQLCRTNPNMAADATHHFAQYLRRNLYAMGSMECVPFRTELQHIHTYVWLEKMRFGEDVEYTEDVETDDFLLPPLSIQPMVENAIKHGMMEMEEGVLHVSVQTRDLGDSVRIVVSDNGSGFDTSAPSDPRSHIGLTNVRERVAMMTGGTLEVESEIGGGTTVTITIPRQPNAPDPE